VTTKLESAIAAARMWRAKATFKHRLCFGMVAKVTGLRIEGISDSDVSLAADILERFKGEASWQRKAKRNDVVPTDALEHAKLLLQRFEDECRAREKQP